MPGFSPEGMNGLVLIDKPQGWTSHDVVNRWRRLAQTKRAGHLGTLDPMATGLLVIVTGGATRLARFFEKNDKVYQAEITLGAVSDTDDAEGEVTETGRPIPERAQIEEALSRFKGVILQVPPNVSAKKVDGVRAYKLARQKKPVELEPVQVEIKRLDVVDLKHNKLWVQVACSAGTYIRALARDLGAALSCGAMLSALRRTASGAYTLDRAFTLEQLQELAANAQLEQAMLPASQMLPEFPALYVDEAAEAQIRQGREFRASPFVVAPGTPYVKALSVSGGLVSIGELKYPNVYHPMMVL